jgi:predicted extracellular nuclease
VFCLQPLGAARTVTQDSSFRSRTVSVVAVLVIAIGFFSLQSAIAPHPAAAATSVFINEIHYDNTGTDAGEAIEIAGPAGTNLTGWSLVLYNGSGGAVYDTRALSGLIPNQQSGFGTVSFSYPVNGIQNGSPDGIALVNASSVVVQFLSYEGTFTAVGGPANGMLSTDIGVSENGTEPVGQSLRLSGTGQSYENFTWNGPATASFGAVNTGQTFAAPQCTTPIVFINEIHYDNTGTDAGEAIEIAGPAGLDLTGWSLLLYNGTGGAVYDTRPLSGLIPNQQGGFGTVSFSYPVNGIQNGSPDGIALVNASSSVVQFLSYEGTFTAVGGPANGMLSTDIGVSENGTEPVGQSLRLSGAGCCYGDFTWTSPATASFGSVNTGQTFSCAGVLLSIDNVTMNEGDSLTTTFTFTVTLSAPAPFGGVTFDIATADGTAQDGNPGGEDNDYVAKSLTGQTITSGNSTYTFDVTVNGDTTVEPSETFFVNVTNVSGATVADGQGLGTIANDDIVLTPIHTIQGASHISPFNGSMVTTTGIVTAKRTNGFYIQDPVPDSDDATSEGIFIFTSSAPTVSVGDAVTVSGTVQEFRSGGSASANLTNTELISPVISVTSSGNPLPPPIIVGIGGRIPPSMVIEDDASPNVETGGVFDPSTDGIDFYESLENMRVQINNAVVVGPSVAFGEIPVVSDDGANASVRTTRGGIVIRSNDFNPERVFLDDEITSTPTVVVGDHFTGPIVGVMDYSFGNFKLEVTSSPVAVSGGLSQEATTLPGADQLAVATFNVENLDPNDPPSKFTDLAGIIVNNLKSPDLIAVEEIQDNNGATNDGVVDATTTYNLLIAAIQTAGGPTYQFRQINPVNNQDGGEPGGNIRVGFLFRTDRGLAFIDRPGGTSTGATTVVNGVSGPELSFSPGRIDPTNAAFNSSRKPLAGEFTFNCRKLFVIANHFISKGGDDPLFGRFQPPTLSSEVQRVQQAQVVNNFVDSVLALDPNAAIVTLGDLNDFEFSNPLTTLKGGVLHDLIESLPQNERYTYVFDGNSQAIDHILLSDSLFNGVPAFDYDVVHVNSEFVVRTSDHEPQVVKLTIPDTPPEIACPASIVAGNDPGFCSAVVNFDAPTVSDNCPGVGAPMCTPPSGSTFPKGTTTVNCSVTDSNSSSSSCSFTVTVNDTQPPVIGSCPANQTVIENPAGSGGAVVTYTAPGASDNCEASVNCAPASGSIFPVGTTTVICTATDPSNNSASCSFTVTVLNAVQVSPAQVWIGLKSSDDVGTNFDLLAEVLKNGSVVGTGQLNNVPGGGSGFNNAVLRTISLALSSPVSISTGDTLGFRLSVRITAVGGHRSGTARLWYNGAAIDTGPTRDAGSRFGATIGGTPADYFLRSGFVLQTTAGSSKLFIDVFADRAVGGNPFKPFGTWSKTF